MAFLVGGTICALGQGVFFWLMQRGCTEEDARALTSMALIFLSAILTGLNSYDKIAKHAGAGTIVPITGFANAMVSPALEFRKEGLILGVGAKMFSIAGPVIVYGTCAATLYGIVLAVLQWF